MRPQRSPIRLIKTALLHRTTLATFKGLLAYLIFFVLFFLDSFNALFALPMAGTSAVLLCIAGFPGKSVGACVQGILMALAGMSLGALNFYLLAIIAYSPVGQAVLFFSMAYLLGLLKASDPRWFVFTLLCLLMSWNGIVTTVNSPTRPFTPRGLISYFTAYLWGAAIVLFVNICVFPHSAEKELRMALVGSLDHCRTFGCLLSKTYRLGIDQEETRVRDELAQTIRADFSLLQSKMKETSIEIVWSKWSLADYRQMVQKTRAIQQILTTVHTNLSSLDKFDRERFREAFLDNLGKELENLNRSMYEIFKQLQKELDVGDQRWEASMDGHVTEDLKVNQDLLQNSVEGPGRSLSRSATVIEAEARLRSVKATLEDELNSDSFQNIALAGSVPEQEIGVLKLVAVKPTPTLVNRQPILEAKKGGRYSTLIESLQSSHASFEQAQYEKIGSFLAFGNLYKPDEQLILESSASPQDIFPSTMVPMDSASAHLPPPDQIEDTEPKQQPVVFPLSPPGFQPRTPIGQVGQTGVQQALIRAFSYSFSLHNFVNEAITLLELVTNASRRKKSIQFHFLEGLFKKDRKNSTKTTIQDSYSNENSKEELDEKVPLSMAEALEALEGRNHMPAQKGVSGWQRLIDLESYLRSPASVCAFKGACGVTVLGVLLWADASRKFATQFNLSSGLITILVALTPTLGQSWLSFIFQVGGQGLGLLYSMILLLIFRNVGGYAYNPYGLVAGLAIFAGPMFYLLYSRPKLFVLCLLALNSAGTSVYIFFLNRRNPAFDGPPLRLGKSLTTLGIAMGVVTSLQLFVLRNPAKHTLRLETSKVMKANTAYTLILQAYVRAAISTDPKRRPSARALRRVFEDLIEREAQIQGMIVSLIPLLNFAAAEPSFVKAFEATQYLRLIKANQLILDRNRDARMAIGDSPLPEFLMKEFVAKLEPHRERAHPHLRISFYLCTSSLQSKFPLPERLPVAGAYSAIVLHDAMVLSVRLSRSAGGLGFVDSRELTRYWSYLLSVTSICDHLEEIEQATHVMFGKMEEGTLRF